MTAKHVARVARSTVDPKMVEAGISLWEKHIIPAMRGARGFRHVYVLGNDPSGAIMTISLWESESDAEAWEKSETHQGLRKQVAAFVTALPVPDTYHVKMEA